MIIIFAKFIDQLIDYPINCASLISHSSDNEVDIVHVAFCDKNMSELTRDHPGKFGRVICVWYYRCTRLVQSMIYSVQNEKQIVGKVLGCCTVIPVN